MTRGNDVAGAWIGVGSREAAEKVSKAALSNGFVKRE